jgi:hypothetical protein
MDFSGELSDYFLGYSRGGGCEDIIRSIGEGSFVASGRYGAVYRLDDNSAEYVVKKTPSDTHTVTRYLHPPTATPTTFGEMRDIFSNTRKGKEFDRVRFLQVNNSEEDSVINPGDSYYVPFVKVAVKCGLKFDLVVPRYYYRVKYDEPGRYERVMRGEFTYPKGSYVCPNIAHSEYALSKIASNSKEECNNFLDVKSFNMCSSHGEIHDYTIMERVHDTVSKLKDIDSNTIESIVIQGLFAISFMTRKLMIQHNDLHLGNIGYILSNESGEYVVDAISLRIPKIGVMIKILDFGLGVKFSEPMIASFLTTESKRVTETNQVIPSWRDDTYDLLLFVYSMYVAFKDKSPFVVCLYAKVLMLDYTFDVSKVDIAKDIIDRVSPLIIRPQRFGRPTFAGVNVRPWDLLKDASIFGKYHNPKPTLERFGFTPKAVRRLGTLSGYHPSFFDGHLNASLKRWERSDYDRQMEFTDPKRIEEICRLRVGDDLARLYFGVYSTCAMKSTHAILVEATRTLNFLDELYHTIKNNDSVRYKRMCVSIFEIVSMCVNCTVFEGVKKEDGDLLARRIAFLLTEMGYDKNPIRLVSACIGKVIQRNTTTM